MSKFDCRIFMASARRVAGESNEPLPRWRKLRDLMSLDGEDFVIQAYRVILNREADPTGLAGFSPRAAGRHGKMAIILSLILSPENTLMPYWLARLRVQLAKCLKNKLHD